MRKKINDLAKPKETIPPPTDRSSHRHWLVNNAKCTCKSDAARKKCTASKPYKDCKRAKVTYLLYEEMKHCTFTPKIKKVSGESKEDDGTSVPGGSKVPRYILKMEAKELKRREDLKVAQGKLDYDAKIDKKCCPNCVTEQKYEEVVGKKKHCQDCNVEYKPKKTWSNVEK